MQTPFAGGLLLARPDDWRLWILNAEAAIVWELHQSGMDPAAIAGHLSARLGLEPSLLLAQVDQLFSDWQAAGLLGGVPDPAACLTTLSATRPPDRIQQATPPTPEIRVLALAGVPLGLCIDDHRLASALDPLLPELSGPPETPVSTLLHLQGPATDWQLGTPSGVLATGSDAASAIVATLTALTDLACQPAQRLLVVHGAGLQWPDGRGLLLIAPGGSGKTTLATALNAGGRPLLSDDVVPVNRDGTLDALGLPICVKAGSWPVLAGWRPDLERQPVIDRLGQSIRYLSPMGQPPRQAIPTGWLVFPRYQQDSTPVITALDPAAALQGLIEAEAVIRHLDQDRLERLAGWISRVPAFAIQYPDLDSGLDLLEQLTGGHACA